MNNITKKAWGIALVALIAAFLGFITPAKDGTHFFYLPLILLCGSIFCFGIVIASRFGSSETKDWCDANF